MPLYTDETFDKSLIPNHFKTDVRELIEVAAAVGWKVHITGAQSVTIIAPGERKKYHFGRRSSNSLNRVRRDIIRFGDPEKVVVMSALARTEPGSITDDSVMRAAAAMIPTLGQEGTIEDDRPEAEVEDDVHTVNEPVVVSQKPMVAKAREGLAYDSPTTIERKWSDGSRDYKCIACDYTSANRGSVPAHHGKAHPVTVKPSMFKGDVPDATVYRPRQNRIDALAAVLGEAYLSGETPDFGEVAKTALTWVHEQTKNKTHLATEAEPMSAEDALDRIRLMLDDGSQYEARKRMAELEERVVALAARTDEAEGRATEMEAKAQAAERRAEQARQTLKAFTDLATELSAGEQEAG